jgi:hypothetical protein
MSPAVYARLAWHVARAALMVAVLKSARPFIWLAERTHGVLFLDIVKGFRRCPGGSIRGRGGRLCRADCRIDPTSPSRETLCFGPSRLSGGLDAAAGFSFP